MEIQIKKAVKAGNSSAVILPRAWLNKDVRVELIKKTHSVMLSEVINILNKHIKLSEIIGIYLTGSYARGEEDKYSDIDILVITKSIDRNMISEESYNILLISSELLNQKLKNDLFPIGPMIKEARPLLNSDYLDSINIKLTKENVKWYINTTKTKLNLIKRVIDRIKKMNKNYVSDRIVYTLVLRIRTLHIIKSLIDNKEYSKEEFIKIIKNISGGGNSYERYLAVKNSLEEKNKASVKETEKLYEYLKSDLEGIKKVLKYRGF